MKYLILIALATTMAASAAELPKRSHTALKSCKRLYSDGATSVLQPLNLLNALQVERTVLQEAIPLPKGATNVLQPLNLLSNLQVERIVPQEAIPLPKAESRKRLYSDDLTNVLRPLLQSNLLSAAPRVKRAMPQEGIPLPNREHILPTLFLDQIPVVGTIPNTTRVNLDIFKVPNLTTANIRRFGKSFPNTHVLTINGNDISSSDLERYMLVVKSSFRSLFTLNLGNEVTSDIVMYIEEIASKFRWQVNITRNPPRP